jgi:hypothetical protein
MPQQYPITQRTLPTFLSIPHSPSILLFGAKKRTAQTSGKFNGISSAGPRRDEVTGGWRKLHNEELRDLYSSPSVIRMMKTGRMIWMGHVARMGEKKNAYRLLVESQREKAH